MPEKVSARFGFPGPSETGQVKVGWDDFDELIKRLEEVLYPPGDLRFTHKATLDTGWLKCEGQEVSRTTYKALFESIGVGSGPGNGSTTFNVPDYRERGPVGPGATLTLGEVTGEATHVLTTGELATHTHVITDPGHAHGVADPGHAHGVADPGHAHGPAGAYSFVVYTGTPAEGLGIIASGPVKTNYLGASTTANGTGIGIYGALTGIGIYAAGTGVSVAAGVTGVTNQSAGSNTGHNNVQPSTICNVWIKT